MDDSQPDSITATDPRVAKILAMIQSQRQQSPIATTPSAPTQDQIAPVQAPMAPPQVPGMPSLAQQLPQDAGAPPTASMPQMQGQAPDFQQPSAPNVTQTPGPGPVKKFLLSLGSHLASGVPTMSESLLTSAGIPTAYDKQQNQIKNNLAQQAQTSLEQYRTAEGGRQDALTSQINSGLQDYSIPNDPMYGKLAGTTLPRSVAVPLMEKMAALANAKDIAGGKNQTAIDKANIQYGPDSYIRHGFKSLSGRDVEYDKGTGDIIKDYGPSNSILTGMSTADARAKAQARYRTFDTVDGNGNPVTISGLDALQGGAAHTPYTQAKGVKSDLVGIQQYDQILNRISNNLPVLNDNAQRIAIAHTLAEADKNPGMAQSIFTSALQNNALTPQGAQLAADIMQGREFGGVARKYGGNMNGTEGLMNRIMANQASPLNSLQLNNDLVANDRSFTQKAKTVVRGLTQHNAGNLGGPPNVAPATQTPANNGGHPAGFHPIGQ